MRKFYFLLAFLLCGVLAYGADGPREATFDKAASIEPTQQETLTSIRQTQTSTSDALSQGKVVAQQALPSAARNRVPARAASIDDVVGSRYLLAHANSTGIIHTNTAATVTRVTDDSVTIAGLIYSDVTVGAKLDLANGKVRVYPQHVVDIDDGPISIAPVDINNRIYSLTDPIEGTIENGNIHLDSPFGFFVTDGAKKGAYLTIGFLNYAYVATSNGTLNYNEIKFDTYLSTNRRTVTAKTDWVYVRQINPTQVRLVHMPTAFGYVDMDVNLGYDGKSATIDPQQLAYQSYVGWYNNYAMTETVTDTTVKISGTLLSPMQATFENGTLKTGKWMVGRLTSSSGSFANLFESSTISTTAAVTFPTMPALNLAGSGTEADPFLIKTPDDWYALSVAANNNAAYRSTTTQTDIAGEAYHTIAAGFYFKLANDIDFEGYNATILPIGDKNYRFAGTLDGDGYAIKNFKIENYAYDYSGLFGAIAPAGTVKNLTVSDGRFTTLGYNVAAIAGINYGLVNNVTLQSVVVQATSGYGAGLAVGRNYGTIDGGKVNGGSIAALGNAGSAAGVTVGTVKNFHASGVTVQQLGTQVFSGGIVGDIQAVTSTQHTKVSGCSFSGTVYSSSSQLALGGIAGRAAYADVERCFAAARILAGSNTQCYMGGLAGAVFNASFTDCYATGMVQNDNSTTAAGLIGRNSSINDDKTTYLTNCYSAVQLTTACTDSLAGLTSATDIQMANCYFDAQMASISNATYGLNTAQMTTADGLPGFSSDVWTFTEGLYPRLKGTEELDNAAVAAAPITLAAGDNLLQVKNNFTYSTANDVVWRAVKNNYYDTTGGHAFDFSNGTGVLNYEQFTDTVVVSRGLAQKLTFVNIAPIPFAGKGTAEEPWLIGTREEVKLFSEMSNNANLKFAEKFIKVIADIDMQGDTIQPIDFENSASPKLVFQGTFDGDGHVIDNFVVCTAGYNEDGTVNPRSALSAYYGGFFGNIGTDGVVKNLIIGPKAQFKLFSYGGAIAGETSGLIDNCQNYANVDVYFARAGGIAGEIKAGGKVTNCYNAGQVRVGYYQAGGIVGYSTSGIIENCLNVGRVAAEFINAYQADGKQYEAGGILGADTKGTVLNNVINAGPVQSYKQIGGVVGTAVATTQISNAINHGFITALADKSLTGQIIGKVTVGAKVTNGLYDNQLQKTAAVASAAYDGVAGKKTSELTSGSVEGLDASVWKQTKDCYPTIALFADKEAARLASLATVNFADGNFASSVTRPAELGNVNSVTWTLNEGKSFTLAGNVLTPIIPEKGSAQDTLVATLGDSKRYVPLGTINAQILPGEGTAANPFQIKTAADVKTLADFVKENQFDFDGFYFKVLNDIDFKDAEFEPVAAAPNTFAADFDGNGKTFSHLVYDVSEDKTAANTALIGTLTGNGSIHDLTLDNTNKISGYNYTAGFVGNLYGKAYNLVNEATVTSAVSYAGGIAAQAGAGASMDNVVNKGEITVKTSYAGGLLGYTAAGANVKVTNSYNEALIMGTQYLGGLAGAASAMFSDCYNTGDVIGTKNYVGGIVAQAMAPSGMQNCYNTGSTMGVQYNGGLAGRVETHTAGVRFVADNCYNTGTVSGTGTAAISYVGGLLGYSLAGMTISNSYNAGSFDMPDGVVVRNIGGILGSSTGATLAAPDTIINCYNVADIKASNNVGGIGGDFEPASSANDSCSVTIGCYNLGSIESVLTTLANAGGLFGMGGMQLFDSWNVGTVTAVANNVGGLIGQMNGNPTRVERNANFGNVTSTSAKGTEVGGIQGYGRALMSDCYNFGEITGYNNVGGLLGKPGPASAASYATSFDRLYNAGKLTATNGTNVGNIFSENTGTKFITTGEQLYYDKEVNAGSAYDATLEAKGLDKREFTELNLGDAFENKTACYPSLKVMAENDYNSFAVAMLLLAEGEVADSVYSDFLVGLPLNATWTCTPNLLIDGNDVELRSSEVGEQATITLTVVGAQQASDSKAKVGLQPGVALTRTYDLVLMRVYTGIDNPVAGKEVKNRVYYNLKGQQVAHPQEGTVVIEATQYTDGTSRAAKVVYRSK